MEDLAQVLQSPAALMVAAGLVIVLFLLAILRVFASGPRGVAVLIVGPCDAGKTTLFLQLRDRSTGKGTVASMHPNEADVKLPYDKASARPIHVVDIPGHPRLRHVFDVHAPSARGVVFLVDSVDFMPKKAEVAEQLYDVLTHPVIAGRRLPVLLACNKADAGAKAHTVDFIRKRLEKEIDGMRSTRGALGGDGAASQAAALSSGSGGLFTFEALATVGKGPIVTCAAVSAVDSGGISDVEAFLRRCVPA